MSYNARTCARVKPAVCRLQGLPSGVEQVALRFEVGLVCFREGQMVVT